MLAVFEKSVLNPPEGLSLPLKGRRQLSESKSGEEVVDIFQSWRADATLYKVPNGSSMALSHEDECPLHPRYASFNPIVVILFLFFFFFIYILDLDANVKNLAKDEQKKKLYIAFPEFKIKNFFSNSS